MTYPDSTGSTASTTITGDAGVVALAGEIDISTAILIRSAFANCGGDVVLDLRRATFVDAAGIGAILGGVRTVLERGGSVQIFGERPAVARVLRMSGIGDLVRDLR